MLVRHYVPQPPLSDFVELLWLYDGYSQPHDKERLLPNGCMELVINLREDQARVYDRRDTRQFQTTRGWACSRSFSCSTPPNKDP